MINISFLSKSFLTMIEIALYNNRDNLLLLLQVICNSDRKRLDNCYKVIVMALHGFCNQSCPLKETTYI